MPWRYLFMVLHVRECRILEAELFSLE